MSKFLATNFADTSDVVHDVINVWFLIKIVLNWSWRSLKSFWIEFRFQTVPYI